MSVLDGLFDGHVRGGRGIRVIGGFAVGDDRAEARPTSKKYYYWDGGGVTSRRQEGFAVGWWGVLEVSELSELSGALLWGRGP